MLVSVFVIGVCIFIVFALFYFFFFFFFNDTATTEIYTLSLHDALPICLRMRNVGVLHPCCRGRFRKAVARAHIRAWGRRSEEHTSELQSPCNLVCRLLLEKKKKKITHPTHTPSKRL